MNLRIAIKTLKRNGSQSLNHWRYKWPDLERANRIVKHYRWKEWKRCKYS